MHGCWLRPFTVYISSDVCISYLFIGTISIYHYRPRGRHGGAGLATITDFGSNSHSFKVFPALSKIPARNVITPLSSPPPRRWSPTSPRRRTPCRALPTWAAWAAWASKATSQPATRHDIEGRAHQRGPLSLSRRPASQPSNASQPPNERGVHPWRTPLVVRPPGSSGGAIVVEPGQAAFLLSITLSAGAVAMAMWRGFIASGISRARSMVSTPLTNIAPVTST